MKKSDLRLLLKNNVMASVSLAKQWGNKEWRQQKDSSRLFYINLLKTAQDSNE